MQQEYKDALMLATFLRALATMLLINAVKLEVADSGYVVDLTSDIRRLQAALLSSRLIYSVVPSPYSDR